MGEYMSMCYIGHTQFPARIDEPDLQQEVRGKYLEVPTKRQLPRSPLIEIAEDSEEIFGAPIPVIKVQEPVSQYSRESVVGPANGDQQVVDGVTSEMATARKKVLNIVESLFTCGADEKMQDAEATDGATNCELDGESEGWVVQEAE